MARNKYDWSGVDWKRSDTAIAHDLGCSRQAVRKRRHTLGFPPATVTAAIQRLDTPNMTYEEMADELGISMSAIYNLCGRLGLSVANGTVKRKVERTGRIPRPNAWTHDWASVDWHNETTTEIAERLGCATGVVSRYRARHNLPNRDGRRREFQKTSQHGDAT